MLLALLIGLGWMSNGFVAQDWVIEHARKDPMKWRWQAVWCVTGAHVVVALWELATRQ